MTMTVTMTNAEWMIQQGYKFSDVHVWYSCSKSDEFVVRIKEKKIDTFKSKLEFPETDEAFAEWLDMEHKEPILDDVERRYLADVIRPFRSRIIWIKKAYRSGNYEQIIIRMKSIVPDAILVDIQFPFFKGNEMYKGMNLGKEYTLEELGL